MSAAAGGVQRTVVDARGLKCPLPVIRLAQAARDLPHAGLVEVWATDPAARADIPAWCRMRGQELVETREEAGEGGGTAKTATADADADAGGRAEAVGRADAVGRAGPAGHTAYLVRVVRT